MRILTPCLIILGTLVWPSMGLADISFNNGVWSTSFDYGQECSGDGCNLINDDSINWNRGSGTNGGPDQSGKVTEAVVSANNPNGAGGMGSRFWIGSNSKDQNTKPNRITFPSHEKELWIRWYMRYEAGFDYGGGPAYDKWLYMHSGASNAPWIIPEPAQGNFRIVGSTFNSVWASPAVRWTDVFGRTSDGLFHMIEIHIKIDTNSTDGVVQMWIDGDLIIDARNMDVSGGNSTVRSGIKWFEFVSNQATPQNARPMHVDFDDFAIYTVKPPNIHQPSGLPWIGPINGFLGAGSLPRPKSPAPIGVSFYDPIEDSNITSSG